MPTAHRFLSALLCVLCASAFIGFVPRAWIWLWWHASSDSSSKLENTSENEAEPNLGHGLEKRRDAPGVTLIFNYTFKLSYFAKYGSDWKLSGRESCSNKSVAKIRPPAFHVASHEKDYFISRGFAARGVARMRGGKNFVNVRFGHRAARAAA